MFHVHGALLENNNIFCSAFIFIHKRIYHKYMGRVGGEITVITIFAVLIRNTINLNRKIHINLIRDFKNTQCFHELLQCDFLNN